MREDILAKFLSVEPLPVEYFFVEINLRKRIWLVCYSYNPHKDETNNHLQILKVHLLLFEICARKICKKFVYKHSETIKYVKN